MIITSHMQKIISIYPCLLKLSHKQETILKIGDFSPKTLLQIYPCWLKLLLKQDTIPKIGDFQPKTKIFTQNPCFKYFHVKPKTKIFPQNLASNISCKNTSKIMIITSHMQKLI